MRRERGKAILRRDAYAVLLGAVLVSWGCAELRGKDRFDTLAEQERVMAPRTVTLTDFSSSGEVVRQADEGDAATNSEPAAGSAGRADESAGTSAAIEEGSSGAAATGETGETFSEIASAANLPEARIESGLIGQVNGRPIFVSEFFEPIERSLEIAARDKSPRDFLREADQIVTDRLINIVQNELVLAEARAGLTTEQRQGVIAWLEQQRQEVTRRVGGGVRSLTDRRLEEESGLGLEEQMKQLERSALVAQEIREEVDEHIVVDWRDVKRYYEEHPEEFSPDAGITLRLIRVEASDGNLIDTVEAELASGRPFEDVARRRSKVFASRGGLLERIALPNGLANTALTRWPEVDAKARELSVGTYGGPIISGPDALWVYVEQYSDGRARSLYEAQADIEAKLIREARAEGQTRYFQKLLARGNADSLDQMKEALMIIVVDRWVERE